MIGIHLNNNYEFVKKTKKKIEKEYQSYYDRKIFIIGKELIKDKELIVVSEKKLNKEEVEKIKKIINKEENLEENDFLKEKEVIIYDLLKKRIYAKIKLGYYSFFQKKFYLSNKIEFFKLLKLPINKNGLYEYLRLGINLNELILKELYKFENVLIYDEKNNLIKKTSKKDSEEENIPYENLNNIIFNNKIRIYLNNYGSLLTALKLRKKNKVKSIIVGFNNDYLLKIKQNSLITGTEHEEIISNEKEFLEELEKNIKLLNQPVFKKDLIKKIILKKYVKNEKIIFADDFNYNLIERYKRLLLKEKINKIKKIIFNNYKNIFEEIINNKEIFEKEELSFIKAKEVDLKKLIIKKHDLLKKAILFNKNFENKKNKIINKSMFNYKNINFNKEYKEKALLKENKFIKIIEDDYSFSINKIKDICRFFEEKNNLGLNKIIAKENINLEKILTILILELWIHNYYNN